MSILGRAARKTRGRAKISQQQTAKAKGKAANTWKTLNRTQQPGENGWRGESGNAGFLGFASYFAPDQLSDSGKLESCQNGAPNTP